MFDDLNFDDDEELKKILADPALNAKPIAGVNGVQAKPTTVDPAVADYLLKGAGKVPSTPTPTAPDAGGGMDWKQALSHGAAGLGDAMSAAAGVPTHHLGDVQALDEKKRESDLAQKQFESGLQEKKDVANVAHKAEQEKESRTKTMEVEDNDVNSEKSKQATALVSMALKKPIPPTSYAVLKATLPGLDNIFKGEFTVGNKEEQQQDAMEDKQRNRIVSIRGDASLKNIETQRDAAIMAYNRIADVEKEGKTLNPVDYVDVLGQIYKARTGSAPTNEVLKEARQATLQGDFGKAYTFFTGNQAPATTKDIMASLKDMVLHMGTQADKMHEAYMAPHMDMPSRLEPSRADKLKKLARGMSFADATGANTAPPPGGSIVYAKNKAGDRVQSSDGGKTWVPVPK